LPKSPTCLSASSGPAWSFPNGLKWGPADIHPFVLSPNSWTWNPVKTSSYIFLSFKNRNVPNLPCNPGFKPEISPVTWTSFDPAYRNNENA
jgi:hypothetical protein